MRSFSMLLASSLLLPVLSQAGSGPSIRIVKMEPVAASGVCTPMTDDGEAHDVLKRFDLNIVNGTETNTLALSRGLLEIEKLAGGRFRPAEGATFKILPQKGCAQQLGQTIVLRHGCGSLDSVAYYVHELGHYIGNNDHAKLYDAYKTTVASRCAVSRYSMKDWTKARARNEEFAEVIAAYVTNPDLLLKSGPSCVKAYNFFRDEVFEKGGPSSCNPVLAAKAQAQAIQLAKANSSKIVVAVKAKVDGKTVLDAKPADTAKPAANVKTAITTKSATEVKMAATKTLVEVKPAPVAKVSSKVVDSKLKPKKVSYTDEDMELDNCSESSVVEDSGLNI